MATHTMQTWHVESFIIKGGGKRGKKKAEVCTTPWQERERKGRKKKGEVFFLKGTLCKMMWSGRWAGPQGAVLNANTVASHPGLVVEFQADERP